MRRNTRLATDDFVSKHSRILALWNEGKTSGDIAEIMRLSRSAVMGILFRARKRGLIERRFVPGEPKRPRTEPQKKRVKRLHLPPVFPIVNDEPPQVEEVIVLREKPTENTVNEPVHFLDARYGQCRYIVGRAPDNLVLFCGADCREGLSYCVAHHKMVYVPFSKMKLSSSSARKKNANRYAK